MKKKLLLILSMVLVGLFTGQNTALAVNMSGISDEQAVTLAFWARMTAKPATTTLGSGKVFVSEDEHEVYPGDEDYASMHSAEGWSDIYLASSLISATVNFKVYAKANAGSYFTGWSFTDGYTDLGNGNGSEYVAVKVNPSPKAAKTNILDYKIYAAFEKVKIVSYEISGDNTMTQENPTCTQTVTFRAETPGFWALSGTDDTKHFKLPVVTPKAGTDGTWTTSITEWNTSNISFYGEYAEIRVPVTFTAPNGNAAEYGAELVLETQAGVKMKVYLSARTTGGEGQAVRYDKNGNEMGRGKLTDMIAAAAATDVVKLNADYASPVTVNKDLTFDLNGYTLSNTLTVSGGNVTVAYSAFGGSANALNVTGGKAILNGATFGILTIGANGTVEQKGAVITGAATNNGTLTTTDGVFRKGLVSGNKLIVNGGSFVNENNDDNDNWAIKLTGGTAQIKRGSIGANTYYGVWTTGGTATIEKLADFSRVYTAALKNEGGTIKVVNGKFSNPGNLAKGEIDFQSGYFLDGLDGESALLEKQVWRNTAGTEFREGYKYFVGDQEAAQASNVSVCRIGKTSYASLDAALSYANNHLTENVIIIMENDYTLKAGYYTVPANATIIVPMSNEQQAANPIVPRSTDGTPMPVQFRKLTLESGVNMTVQGTIELSCTQYGSGEEMGIPGGNYGHLVMKPGSHMVINSGGELRAWGFVTGDGSTDAEGNYLSGEIDARRGAVVREMFQMGDWKGGDISFTMAMEIPGMNPVWRDLTHLFPVYTYFIQNVESPVKYHPGSSLICATSVNVAKSINAYANDIKVVGKEGEAAMFLMDEMADAENTWVRKFYDPKKDQQVYEVNSAAQLGSVVINLGEVPAKLIKNSAPAGLQLNLMLDSRSFVLPLTSNFKIHLLTGYMEFTQSTSCLPGMEVEVDKEAEVALVKNKDPKVASGALYFYDAAQWTMDGTKGYVGNNGRFGKIVRYSATLDAKPTARSVASPAAIGDAKLIVHGTFRSDDGCSVYTSWSKDMTTMGLKEDGTGGASIISTNEDAGTFIFDADAPAFDGLVMDPSTGMPSYMGTSVLVNYDHNDYGMDKYPITINTVMGSSARVYGFELFTPAKLRNADGTLVETEGTLAGTSFCYMNGQWTTMQVAEDPCFMKEIIGGATTYYAKPSEYVAVNATWDADNVVMVGNADHTFSDADGSGRLFILIKEDCQWWEVEKKDNLYHCIHPNNDTYYYWDETESKWKEQRFTITWLNDDGTEIKSYIDGGDGEPEEVQYSVPYGTQAEFLGQNPTREPNDDYTYDFIGWTPALGKVTSNVTYTATYKAQPREYTIIFLNEGDDEIERHLLRHNDLPVCENAPTRTGHTLQWEPALAAVTGDATYRATWLEVPPTEYEIRFADYDDTELQKTTVAVGELPEYNGAEPVKKQTDQEAAGNKEFSYIFDHWAPTVVRVTQAMTYTAVYREIPKTYTVIFKNENNSVIETNTYHYGETPVCSATPVKESDNANDYTFAWYPQIQTVMGNAEYKATFTPVPKKYALTLKCSPSGAATFTGARADYIYGASAEVTVTPSDPKYVFEGWSDLESTDPNKKATSRTVTITGDITLVAEFSCSTCDNVTITWRNYDGSLLKEVSQPKGTTTTYTGEKPERPATEAEVYTFDGWSTVKGGDLVYKNGMTPKAAEGGATYYAHYAVQEIPNLTVTSGSTTVLQAPTTCHNLVLTSNGVTSGQLLGESNLSLTGDAYFDFAVNAVANKWYSFAVPWQVNTATGLSADGRKLSLGRDCYILSYNGERRAEIGPQRTWDYLSNGTILQPGTTYMILLTSNASVIRFAKKYGADLLTTTTEVYKHPAQTGNATDAGWNGVANPALFHAYVNTSNSSAIVLGQVYNSANDSYSSIVVGQGVFVRAAADKTVSVTYGSGYVPSAAPRRAVANTNTSKFEVRIAPANQEYTDRIFVQTDESKTPDVYTVGKDLAKMGVSSSVAQMWIDRYDAKLLLNTMAPVAGTMDYPLGIFAPEAGEYSIGILRTTDMQADDLYLTLDGEVIWNLSRNAYTALLEQGSTSRYGLRTVAKTPQVTTGLENTALEQAENTAATKVLINNHVYIIRGEKMYTVDGQLVK